MFNFDGVIIKSHEGQYLATFAIGKSCDFCSGPATGYKLTPIKGSEGDTVWACHKCLSDQYRSRRESGDVYVFPKVAK